ncbi:MAG: diguanylate cyclase (GGDEF)-like protein [Alphaproteobacteria bacterium]|jgi:diguanylate cyclase (GGDEF)-like protein
MFILQAHAQNTKNPVENSLSQIPMNLDEFIDRYYTPTFDCPPPELLSDIKAYLAEQSTNEQQKFQLTSMKTHSLICGGKSTDAQSILKTLLAAPSADRNAKYYVSAIYQLGFVYDVQENPERCDYYQLAIGAAQDKFNDIHLSASLGYITECIKNRPDEQLAGVYKLLETVTKMDDKAALAHAYNRVGSLYGKRGQSKLSASQYMKAYDASIDIYTDENKLALLNNAIVALMASNQLDEAKIALDDYIALNKNVNTAGSDFIEYFLASGYYMRVKDYVSLASNLGSWDRIASDHKNPIYQGVYRWYSSVMCYQNNDLACLRDFLESEQEAPASYQNFIAASKDYLYFIAQVNVALGDKEASLAALETYSRKMIYAQTMIEDSIESLNIASLHSKIGNLESTLQAQQTIRNKIIYAFIGLLLVIIVGLVFFAVRKSTASKSIDSATGLLNNTTVINKLTHLAAPGAKRTNALAIFDIANFMEVNLTAGSTKSDIVLQEIANTLKHIIRNSDILGRFGPEHFILCLADIEEEAAQAFFERTKNALGSTFSDYNNQQVISVDSSMSIFYSTDAFTDIDEVLNNMLLSLSMKSKHPE